MIGQYSPSCSHVFYESLMQEEDNFCEAPPPVDLDVLQIIEKNKSFLHYENRYTSHKKWTLKIRKNLASIIDHLVISFANKLIKLNCGSAYEKRLFLSAISRRITYQPFANIEDVLISSVRKIQLMVVCCADEKMESITNSGPRDYDDLKQIILKNAKKNLSEEHTILELTQSISSKISEFYKTKYIEKELELHIDLNELRQRVDIEKTPFTEFVDSYRYHIGENHHYLLSKSIEIFCDMQHDEECLMSFVFDTFLGSMVYHSDVVRIHSIIGKISGDVSDFIVEVRRLGGIANLKKFSLDSVKKIKEKMEKFLLEDNITVFYGNTISTCNKETMEKIVNSSVEYLNSCVDQFHL